MHPLETELDGTRMERLDPREPVGKRPGLLSVNGFQGDSVKPDSFSGDSRGWRSGLA